MPWPVIALWGIKMLDINQFRDAVLKPVLGRMGFYTKESLIMLIGTALTESNFTYLQQIKGPALGLYQMEPRTHDDIWENYLKYRPSLVERVECFLAPYHNKYTQLAGNLMYATAMCRVHYLRVQTPIPKDATAQDYALYHKKYYNTVMGKTDPKESQQHFQRAIDLVGPTLAPI